MLQSNLKRKLAFATTALAAGAFAGGAYAATQDSPANVGQAFLSDVANRLDVTPPQLTAALRGALLDRLSAAVAAGKLTKSQAAAIRQRIEHGGDAPLAGFGWFGQLGLPGPPVGPGDLGGLRGPRFFGRPGDLLQAATKFLDLSELKLVSELRAGKSLAQLARAEGKSTSGLKAALITAARARLARAQRDGIITRAQEQKILGGLSARVDEELGRAGLDRREPFGAHDPGRPGMPPPGGWADPQRGAPDGSGWSGPDGSRPSGPGPNDRFGSALSRSAPVAPGGGAAGQHASARPAAAAGPPLGY